MHRKADSNKAYSYRLAIALLIFVIIFAGYLKTIIPSCYVGDSGELAVVPEVLTVAHPTGYPTFSMLGKIFILFLFSGNMAYKVSIFCALATAYAVMFLFFALDNLIPYRLISALAAIAFGFSQVMWSQAVIVEVYPLNAFFFSLMFWLSTVWVKRRTLRMLVLLSFIYGMSLTNHMTMILALPGYLVFICYDVLPGWQRLREYIRSLLLWELRLVILGLILLIYFAGFLLNVNSRLPFSFGHLMILLPILFLGNFRYLHSLSGEIFKHLRGNGRSLVGASTAFILAFSTYIFLAIRALDLNSRNAICSLYWGDLTQFREWFGHITGAKFQTLMFTHPIKILMQNLCKFLYFVNVQYTPIGFVILLIGFFYLYQKNRKVFWYTFLLYFFNFWFCVNYEIIDIEVFYIPTWFICSVWLGYGFVFLIGFWSKALYAVGSIFEKGASEKVTQHRGALIFVILLVLIFIANFYYCDRSNYYLAHDYGMNVFHSIKGKATLLTQGWISPYILGYLQVANQARPDVTVIIEGRGKVLKKLTDGSFQLPEGFKVYTTVPLEIIGLDKFTSQIRGLVYELGRIDEQVVPYKGFWDTFRERDIELDDIRVYKDYQSRSLLAKFHYLKGEFLWEHGKHKEAMQMYNKAAQIAPGNKQVHNNLACIFFKRGLFDEAKRECLTALSIDPNFQQARHNLGNILYKMGNFNEALAQFEVNTRRGFALDFYRPVVAQIYLKQGEYKKAIIEYRNALKLEPKSVELHNNLGIAYQKDQQFEEALKAFQTALQLNPNYAQTYNNMGNVYESLGDFQNAQKYYERAIELKPDLADAYNNLGILYGKQGNLERSVKILKQALKIKPDYYIALNNLGIAYLQMGKSQQAIKAWQESLKIEPAQKKILEYIQIAQQELAP